jgi:RNA polymerase sigma factor for flagellar operon FliA
VTPEEEKEWWIRFKEKRESAARDTLAVHYMRTVKFIAGRMAIHVPSSVDLNDLIGWGTMGLLDAIDKFDHKQQIKFSTYASIRIRGAIIDQIRTLDWAPRSLRTMAREVASARDKLRQELGREPSTSDIANALGTTEEHVDDTVTQLQTAQVLSLDDYLPGEDSEEVRKVNMVSNASAPDPSHLAEMQERKQLLAQAIMNLPEQQQKVLTLYYFEDLTLKEIGMVLDVSESRICQVHRAAMKTLQQVMREAEAR